MGPDTNSMGFVVSRGFFLQKSIGLVVQGSPEKTLEREGFFLSCPVYVDFPQKTLTYLHAGAATLPSFSRQKRRVFA